MSSQTKVNVGDVIAITRYNDREVYTEAVVTDTRVWGPDLYARHHHGDILQTYKGDQYFIDAAEDEYRVIGRAEEPTSDNPVEHPGHYTQGKFETIEMIEEITKGYDDGYVAYCVGNALKYLARAPFKHDEPTEDLQKAATYIGFATEYLTKVDESEDE